MQMEKFFYRQPSLYVGDLNPDVTEALLYQKFTSVAPIHSIRICRDYLSRYSLGYAYVNFYHLSDAQRALTSLNFEPLNGKPMRLMWSNRDPSLRRNGIGNVFIKNLDKSITSAMLYDTLSGFGSILSCKVRTDPYNRSLGYGFVHFESQKVADDVIANLTGMHIKGKEVMAARFVPKFQRVNQALQNPNFYNVYIKNFADLLSDEEFYKLFEPYGQITSYAVMKDSNGVSLGFGFCCFEKTQSAQNAVKELNGTNIKGRMVYVSRALKKHERLVIGAKSNYLIARKKYPGINLYIKHLDDYVTDDMLKEEFSKYGNVLSAKIITDNGRSKGFGFVSYGNKYEAEQAINATYGIKVWSKPLYVALHQTKQERNLYLQAQFRRYHTTPIGSITRYQIAIPSQIYG